MAAVHLWPIKGGANSSNFSLDIEGQSWMLIFAECTFSGVISRVKWGNSWATMEKLQFCTACFTASDTSIMILTFRIQWLNIVCLLWRRGKPGLCMYCFHDEEYVKDFEAYLVSTVFGKWSVCLTDLSASESQLSRRHVAIFTYAWPCGLRASLTGWL